MSTFLAWVGVYCVVVVLAVGTWALVHQVVRWQSPRPAVTPIASPGRLPRRIPAPPAMSPRPDLEAALAANVARLNGDIDRALAATPAPRGLSAGDVEHVIATAIRATRGAANHTNH